MSGAAGQQANVPGRLARDAAWAGAALVLLLVLPLVFPSKLLLDYIIRVAAFGIFATSLNMLVGFGGMVSFGHGMFFGGGGFGLLMQRPASPFRWPSWAAWSVRCWPSSWVPSASA
jgi:branched-chain amino acid transport system permease protein